MQANSVLRYICVHFRLLNRENNLSIQKIMAMKLMGGSQQQIKDFAQALFVQFFVKDCSNTLHRIIYHDHKKICWLNQSALLN
jgi:hypothetical protein